VLHFVLNQDKIIIKSWDSKQKHLLAIQHLNLKLEVGLIQDPSELIVLKRYHLFCIKIIKERIVEFYG
jgi:hypothetical protein